jgi:hypothetical protein
MPRLGDPDLIWAAAEQLGIPAGGVAAGVPPLNRFELIADAWSERRQRRLYAGRIER